MKFSWYVLYYFTILWRKKILLTLVVEGKLFKFEKNLQITRLSLDSKVHEYVRKAIHYIKYLVTQRDILKKKTIRLAKYE